MKVFGIIMKILAALAVVAGIAYIVATYGDKIVAWTKKMLGKLECCCGGDCCCGDDCCCEEAPAEAEVQAEEVDFEG